MTTNQYLAALQRLGLTRYGQETRDALGLSRRQLHRLTAGYPVNSTLEKLLLALIALAALKDA